MEQDRLTECNILACMNSCGIFHRIWDEKGERNPGNSRERVWKMGVKAFSPSPDSLCIRMMWKIEKDEEKWNEFL